LHHRVMGTAQNSGLRAKFKYGAKDYAVGNHPLWQLFRSVYQMRQRPVVIGGIALASGYFWSMIRRIPRPVPQDLVEFSRYEQMRRLSRFVGSKLPPRTAGRAVGARD
jgi:poly-beta-1,6-N-acetyl-D-glucosamine synthase